MDIEELRQRLLNEIYAGAASGLSAMLLDESIIKNADESQLLEIAKQYGYYKT